MNLIVHIRQLGKALQKNNTFFSLSSDPMEPEKTYGAVLPSQEQNYSAGEAPSGPRFTVTENSAATRAILDKKSTTNIPLKLTRLEVLEILVSNARLRGPSIRPIDLNVTHRTDIVMNAIYPEGIPDIIHKRSKMVQDTLTKFLSKCEIKYKDCHRKQSAFINKNKTWLSTAFDLGVLLKESVVSSDDEIYPDKQQERQAISEFTQIIAEEKETHMGQADVPSTSTPHFTEPANPTPISLDSSQISVQYENLSNRQQRRVSKRLVEELENQPTAKILKVFPKIITDNEGNTLSSKSAIDFEFVTKECLKTPIGSTTIANMIKSNQQSARQHQYSPDEALCLIIDRKFTVEDYMTLYNGAKARGHNIYPPYYKVESMKKNAIPMMRFK